MSAAMASVRRLGADAEASVTEAIGDWVLRWGIGGSRSLTSMIGRRSRSFVTTLLFYSTLNSTTIWSFVQGSDCSVPAL